VRADRSEPQEKGGVVAKLGIDATRRDDARADWRRAQPPAHATRKARELLGSLSASPSTRNAYRSDRH
jgi:hypothetical protein